MDAAKVKAVIDAAKVSMGMSNLLMSIFNKTKSGTNIVVTPLHTTFSLSLSILLYTLSLVLNVCISLQGWIYLQLI